MLIILFIVKINRLQPLNQCYIILLWLKISRSRISLHELTLLVLLVHHPCYQMWENHYIQPFPKLLFHPSHSHYVQRVHYFHKAQFENMIDCFAMFPSPPLGPTCGF